jgi:transposase
VDGYLDWTIVQGSITQASYIQFIRERVLPHCNTLASGLERSVLVMDNAKVHYSPELLEICAVAGVHIEYLPPYSPDFNPIETSFSVLKAYIRRHSDEAALWASSGMFGEFLNNAVRSQITAYNARNLFRKARIGDGKNEQYQINEVNDSDESENNDLEGDSDVL